MSPKLQEPARSSSEMLTSLTEQRDELARALDELLRSSNGSFAAQYTARDRAFRLLAKLPRHVIESQR